MRRSTFAALTLIVSLIAFAGQSAKADLVPLDLVNLNFFASTNNYTGNTETSPATGVTPGAAGVWNNISLANVEQDVSVVSSDNSNSVTLSFDSGRAGNWSQSNQTNTVNFTGGVYNVPNLYESGVTTSSTGQSVGLRIQGLTPGTYEVFMVPFFRNMAVAGVKEDQGARILIGLGNTSDVRGSGTYALTSTAANPTQHIDTTFTSWVDAADVDPTEDPYNYVGATVTIDSTARWLTFILETSTSTTNGDRAGMSAIQLRMVAIPEVSAFLLVGLVGTLSFGVSAIRRSRQSL